MSASAAGTGDGASQRLCRWCNCGGRRGSSSRRGCRRALDAVLVRLRPQGKSVFYLLTAINTMVFLDRGILPGASQEVNAFIETSVGTTKPDIYLGQVQSAFIVGFAASSLVFANLTHRCNSFTLIGAGMAIFTGAVVLTGAAKFTGSFWFLFGARLLTGVGEASFQCVVPPYISDNALPHERGKFLALFFTAVPVGTALGYVYGSLMAASPLGWNGAYLLEAPVALPLLLACFALAAHPPATPAATTGFKLVDGGGGSFTSGVAATAGTADVAETPSAVLAPAEEGALVGGVGGVGGGGDGGSGGQLPTWRQEAKAVLRRPIFVCIVLGYAATCAVLVSLSTFGSGLIVAMGLFASEQAASAVFGALVAVAGIVGTTVGGRLIDNNAAGGEARQLLMVLWHMWTLACLAAVFFVGGSLVITLGTFPFLGCLFVGAVAIFAANGIIAAALMLAVPPANRAFALAINTFGLHVLGDVPAPIVVGLLKDMWAPDCAIAGGAVASLLTGATTSVSETATSVTAIFGGSLHVSEACVAERGGLQRVLVLLALWLAWSCLYYGLAYALQKRRWGRRGAGAEPENSPQNGPRKVPMVSAESLDDLREPLLSQQPPQQRLGRSSGRSAASGSGRV